MEDIAGRPALPMAVNQKLQAVAESPVDAAAPQELHIHERAQVDGQG